MLADDVVVGMFAHPTATCLAKGSDLLAKPCVNKGILHPPTDVLEHAVLTTHKKPLKLEAGQTQESMTTERPAVAWVPSQSRKQLQQRQ